MSDSAGLLPEGIVRVADVALAAKERISADMLEGKTSGKVSLAVFDFDGTCLGTSSTRRLVGVLGRGLKLNFGRLVRIGLWALAYKLNISRKDPVAVRERVFSAFQGKPASYINKYLADFYHERVASFYRAKADEACASHIEQGHIVALVSASFEPIIAAAMTEHPIQFALASRMKIDEAGCYTNKCDGLPTEGPNKMVVLREFCNKQFGDGNWEIGWAYADHYSDLEVLNAAEHAFAVNPDGKLERYAKEQGWEILDWD